MSNQYNDKVIEIWQSEYDELNKVKQEFEVYKKALELACESLNNHLCTIEKKCSEDGDCNKCAYEYFLQKAREEK